MKIPPSSSNLPGSSNSVPPSSKPIPVPVPGGAKPVSTAKTNSKQIVNKSSSIKPGDESWVTALSIKEWVESTKPVPADVYTSKVNNSDKINGNGGTPSDFPPKETADDGEPSNTTSDDSLTAKKNEVDQVLESQQNKPEESVKLDQPKATGAEGFQNALEKSVDFMSTMLQKPIVTHAIIPITAIAVGAMSTLNAGKEPTAEEKAQAARNEVDKLVNESTELRIEAIFETEKATSESEIQMAKQKERRSITKLEKAHTKAADNDFEAKQAVLTARRNVKKTSETLKKIVDLKQTLKAKKVTEVNQTTNDELEGLDADNGGDLGGV